MIMKIKVGTTSPNITSSIHERTHHRSSKEAFHVKWAHDKVKFPLKISDRAWWLEVQVLKSHGNKSRRKNDRKSPISVSCYRCSLMARVSVPSPLIPLRFANYSYFKNVFPGVLTALLLSGYAPADTFTHICTRFNPFLRDPPPRWRPSLSRERLCHPI